MSLLDRKLVRDLRRMQGQFLTIALVVAVGVASYITLRTAWRALGQSRATYYESYRFADVFASVKRAPDSVADRVAELPGVSKVHARIAEQVLLPVEGLIAPARGELISLPSHGRAALNDVLLRSGRYPEPGRGKEVLVYEPFAKAHGLIPGSTLPAVLNGKLHDLIVVGLALSPEFVFAVEPGTIAVDDERYAPLWMSEEAVEAAFQMQGAFNSLLLRLEHGANEDAVLNEVDRILDRYGGLGAFTREQQMSHLMLTGELQQIETLVLFLPGVFLAVAAFLLNVVFSRLVTLQRAQIAIIKALGYGNQTIAWHYLKMVSLIVAVGSVLGVALGAWLGNGMLDLYAQFFRLPMIRSKVDLPVSINAILASFVAAVTGVAIAVARAVRLPPAEAMRPPSPARYHSSAVEGLPGLRRVSQTAMMIFREVWRRPFRTLLSSLGIAFALGIVILGRFGKDAMEPMIEVQFGQQQREDIAVSFDDEVDDGSLSYLASLPGVDQLEGLRQTPVRARFGARWRDTVLIGIAETGQLRRLFSREFEQVAIPHDGVLLTDILAEVLGAKPGDLLEIELKEGDRGTRQLRISGTVDEAFGIQGYMQKQRLHALLREEASSNTALLRIDPQQESELQQRLTDIPRVQGIHRKRSVLEKFEEQTRRTMSVVTLILTLFATAIAVAVVYNNARVSLSVRNRDLATLRVLGFTKGEISSILLGEQAIQVLLGIPLGLVLGTLGAQAIAQGQADPEQFRIPMTVSTQTYAFSILVIVASAVFSALLVRRRLDSLDLIAVLKARE